MRPASACLLLFLIVPAPLRAQQAEAPPSSVSPDTAAVRGRTEGADAARGRGAAGWFWGGFVAGLPAGPGALAFLLGGEPGELATYTVAGVGASLAVAGTAAGSPVDLPPEQSARLAEADSAYAAGYRHAYTEAVRRRRAQRAVVGSAAGMTTSAALLYALLCLAFCGEYT